MQGQPIKRGPLRTIAKTVSARFAWNADRVRMEPGAMVRDEKAVKRVFEGLVKLVFPDGEASPQDLQKYLDLAVELRQAVIMEKYALHHETADFRTLRARIV